MYINSHTTENITGDTMNIFDILGPVMVGPSSSHTAGAVRIGRVSRKLLNDIPSKAEIFFHGSFALTGVGHGTDKAVVAGLLGMETDDIRIPRSLDIARKQGFEFTISPTELKDAHPNTVFMRLKGKNGRELEILASSTGGGRISIDEIDGIETGFTGDYNTLVVHNTDTAGHIALVSTALSEAGVNIAALRLCRNKRGGYAVMVAETDQPIPASVIERVENAEGIIKLTYLNV